MRTASPVPAATSPLFSVENHPAIWALYQAFEQRRRAFLGLLLVLLAFGLPGCGGSSREAAEDGTTVAAPQCSGPPVVTQAEGGVFITYCGATTFAPATQIAAHAPWSRGQQ